MKAMGRSVGAGSSAKVRARYVEGLSLYRRGGDLQRVRHLLEPAAKNRKDKNLAADATYLLLQLSPDTLEASIWFKRMKKKYSDHPNMVPAQLLYDRIRGKSRTIRDFDPLFGEFVRLMGDSTGIGNAELQLHEVTKGEWERVFGHDANLGDHHPQSDVDITTIDAWLEMLNRRDGEWSYRLPTIAEWRGAVGQEWPQEGYPLSEAVWYNENACGKLQRTAVKKANEFGFYDLLGNVAEWCRENRTGEWCLCGGSVNSDSSAIVSLPIETMEQHPSTSDAGFRLVRERRQ
jgi:hypothetical protein